MNAIVTFAGIEKKSNEKSNEEEEKKVEKM